MLIFILPFVYLLFETADSTEKIWIGTIATALGALAPGSYIVFKWWADRQKTEVDIDSSVTKDRVVYEKLLKELRDEIRTLEKDHGIERDGWEQRLNERWVKTSSLQKIIEEAQEESIALDRLFEKMRLELEDCQRDQSNSKSCSDCIDRTLGLLSQVERGIIGHPEYVMILAEIGEWKKVYGSTTN